MNVLYFGGFDLPDKNAAAQRVIANAKILRDIGWAVTLVGLDKKPGAFSFDGFDCINLKYPSSPIEWWRYLATIKDYRALLQEREPQLVIAYNHPAVALEKMLVYCKTKGIKVLSDCTEWYTPEGNVIQRTVKSWDTKKRMTDVQMRIDGVISISRYLHEYYSSRGQKSILVPPLVDAKSAKWQGTVKKGCEAISLAYAGSPGHKDRLDVLVRIVSELSEKISLRFEIIGLDRDQFIRLYNYEQTIPAEICFHGRLPHEETLHILRGVDFQIFIREDNLTTRAGFPTKFVESITSCVPVLTNLTSNIGDYLSIGKNGFPVDASTEEALRQSLEQVLSMPRETLKGVRDAIDSETFDYRRYKEQFKEFIDKL